jgi:hypothetical protein
MYTSELWIKHACLPSCLPALSGSKWNYLLMKASCKKITSAKK